MNKHPIVARQCDAAAGNPGVKDEIFGGMRMARVYRVSALASMAAVALLLSGCDKKDEQAGRGNIVEMGDMDVVEGTINDSMTDLSAAASEGTLLAPPMPEDENASTTRTGNNTAQGNGADDAADTLSNDSVAGDNNGE